MTDNDILTDAYNDYEKLLKEAEEKDYKTGWVFYRLKEKYGEKIANEVYGDNRGDWGDYFDSFGRQL